MWTRDLGTSERSSCPLATDKTLAGHPTRGFPCWTGNSKAIIAQPSAFKRLLPMKKSFLHSEILTFAQSYASVYDHFWALPIKYAAIICALQGKPDLTNQGPGFGSDIWMASLLIPTV